jgi:hypothetical protein
MTDRPRFLPPDVTLEKYRRWLDRKTAALVRRDVGRGNKSAARKAYKQAIHDAVLKSGGRDAYTGELLNWSLIGTYDNTQSQALRRAYKATLGLAADRGSRRRRVRAGQFRNLWLVYQ